MGATFDSNVTVNLLTTGIAVDTAEFGLICYASNDTTFAVGVHKIYETPQDAIDDGELSAQAKAAMAVFFSQSPRPPRIMVCEATDEAVGGELASSLDAAYAAQAFYTVILQNSDDVQVIAADAWVGTNELQQWAASQESTILAGGVPIDTLNTSARNRTMVVYHDDDTEELAVALAAKYFSANPDTETSILAYKTADGIGADDITSSEKTLVLAENANLYLPFGSVPVISPGTVSGGDFVDQVLSQDWYKARVIERIQQLLIDKSALNSKIPYTDEGLAELEAQIRAVQDLGERIGHFEPGASTITVPKLADIPPATRATRAATISAQVTLAGAIQTVTINLAVLRA